MFKICDIISISNESEVIERVRKLFKALDRALRVSQAEGYAYPEQEMRSILVHCHVYGVDYSKSYSDIVKLMSYFEI